MTKQQRYQRQWYKLNRKHVDKLHNRYYREHKDELLKYKQEYYHAHKEKWDLSSFARWTKNLWQFYGLTVKAYRDLATKQGHKCAICIKRVKGKLFVDHDHKTNNIRGLLCSKCNFGVGLFNDDPKLLKSATNYLEVANG